MKEVTYITFNLDERRWPRVQLLLQRIGRPDLAIQPRNPYGYTLEFRGVEAAEAFLAEWEGSGFDPGDLLVRRERSFSPVELRRSDLLHLLVNRPPKGNGGPSHGTQYDFGNACRVCGTGAVQVSPLLVRGRALETNGLITQTLDREILVRPEIAAEITRAGLTGVETWPAIDAKSGATLKWQQLVVKHAMPPMDPSSRGFVRERPCRVCGRDGYFQTPDEPEEIRYKLERDEVERLPDFVLSYEHLGNSTIARAPEESHLARPMLIINPPVMSVLQAARVRGIDLLPVRLIPTGPW